MTPIPAVIRTAEEAALDFVLLTTCDYQGGRRDELERLIESVKKSVAEHGLRVRHYLLLQRCQETDPAPEVPAYTELMRVGRQVSLSAARNLMLRKVHADGVLAQARTVCFPDDDAWYPDGTLSAIATLFARDAQLGVIICRYASSPVTIKECPGGLALARRPGSKAFVVNASSNTLFVRASVVEHVRYFDERLGVGAALNGGEDLDFALRARAWAKGHALWLDAPLVGHRDKNRTLRARYFTGSLYAIARSSGDPGVAVQALRKIAVGLYMVVTGDFAPRDWLHSVRVGLQGRSQPEPEVSSQ
ncbi:glycosyltransferase family 2 protein [Silvimonas iriomotensis]|uniref:Glycosyl transferase family 2 n=1 Tax=Silvimonas iriomotensis TaxID=449662 RepID=A0ABQ2P8H7_9NEIS|nr:hypothetical protein [Silvimonas iriomotensis]GGP20965.1 hypothetical protein GCM10010970_17840 [Silvimonas iriomotensis]